MSKRKLSPEIEDQLEVLRRIAERGLRYSQIAAVETKGYEFSYKHSSQIDLWQHLLDELQRIRITK